MISGILMADLRIAKILSFADVEYKRGGLTSLGYWMENFKNTPDYEYLEQMYELVSACNSAPSTYLFSLKETENALSKRKKLEELAANFCAEFLKIPENGRKRVIGLKGAENCILVLLKSLMRGYFAQMGESVEIVLRERDYAIDISYFLRD